MAITQTVTCDQCGAVRQQSNHWWVMVNVRRSFQLLPWAALSDHEIFAPDTRHICGQACVIQELNAFMQEAGK